MWLLTHRYIDTRSKTAWCERPRRMVSRPSLPGRWLLITPTSHVKDQPVEDLGCSPHSSRVAPQTNS